MALAVCTLALALVCSAGCALVAFAADADRRAPFLSPIPFTAFPVRPYKGTKSVVISTVSWIGGKNPFLGWAYVAAAGLLVLLGILGTVRHLVKPR